VRSPSAIVMEGKTPFSDNPSGAGCNQALLM
jgi:hypothetical protein